MLTDEQNRAIKSDKSRIIVSASAGSGKTSTMVLRVLELIERGVEASHIVMMTYTESAAREMMTRLSDALIDRIRSSEGEERQRFVLALDALPTLTCGTIHSYCYRLIMSNFELVGLSPLHAIIDEDASNEMMRRAFTKLVREEAAKDNATYVDFASQFGSGGDDGLMNCVFRLYSYIATKGGLDYDTEDGDDSVIRELISIASQPMAESAAAQYVVTHYNHSAELYVEPLTTLRAEAESVGAVDVVRYTDTLLQMVKSLQCDSVRDFFRECDSDTLKKLKDDVRHTYPTLVDKLDFLEKECKSLIEDRATKRKYFRDFAQAEATYLDCADHTIRLLDFTKKFKDVYDGMKEDARVLDFSDLERYALRLLNKREVREALSAEYVLVDECQDVNAVQSKLIEYLCSGKGLFYVGDVKQSIFRFRQADPDIFIRLMEEGKRRTEDHDYIPFDRNFRSSDAVIDFVNAIFVPVMKRSFGGVDYAPLIAPKENPADGSVRCFFYEKEKQKATVDAVYSVKNDSGKEGKDYPDEVKWIRDRIKEVVGTTLYDTKKKAHFTVRYQDIAIISRTRSTLAGQLIDCLRADRIPMNLGKFESREKSTEGAELADLLRLVLSPHDDHALLSVMRSPMFAFSVSEMARIGMLEGKYFYEKAAAYAETPEGAKVAELFRYVERLVFDASVFSFPELLHKIVDERFRAPLLREPDGRLRLGKLLTFIEEISANARVTSVSQFIEYYDNYYSGTFGGESREADAVNFMTIHASKGLEYPIVFLMGTGDEMISTNESRERLLVDKDMGAHMKSFVDADANMRRNLTYIGTEFKRKKEQKEDAMRLLYVALTRARNSLFVSGAVVKNRYDNLFSPELARTFAEWISFATRQGWHVDRYYVEPQTAAKVETPSQEASLPNLDAIGQAFSYEYPHKKATVTGIKYTVTGINNMDEEGYSPPKPLFPEERIEKGTALHAVMEHIPFTLQTMSEVEEALDRLAEQDIITSQERKEVRAGVVLDAVRKISALVGERRVEREKTFMLKVPAREVNVAPLDDEVAVQGKLDLIAVGEDAIIVDYKASGAPEEVLRERYREQLSLYSLAVRKSMAVKEISSYIFVLGRNILIKV